MDSAQKNTVNLRLDIRKETVTASDFVREFTA